MVRLLIGFVVVVVVSTVLWFLSGFVHDPLGFTTRAQIRSTTAIETTRFETDAAVQIAETESAAKVEIAELQADAEITKASERRRIHQTWARTSPLLLIIIAAAGALWFAVTYWGRALLLLIQHVIDRDLLAALLLRTQKSDGQDANDPVDEMVEDALDEYAAQRNQYVIRQNGCHVLVDSETDEVVSQLARK